MNHQKEKRIKRKAQALKLLSDGITKRGICRMMSMSECTLNQYMREEGMTVSSASEKKKLRNSRATRALELTEDGWTRDQIATEMGVKRSTVNSYLRQAGYIERSNKESNQEKALQLSRQGLTAPQIAQAMCLRTITIRQYIWDAKRRSRMKCEKCGNQARLDRFRGKSLCPDCLNPDEKIGIEYADAWGRIANSGVMECV